MSGMSTSKVQLCIATAIGAAGAIIGSAIWLAALGFPALNKAVILFSSVIVGTVLGITASHAIFDGVAAGKYSIFKAVFFSAFAPAIAQIVGIFFGALSGLIGVQHKG
jgi:hypothetical protein